MGVEIGHLAFKAKNILLRVFSNKKLRKIFGPEREELAGGWRKL
jgi:hypothetical protein